MNKRKTDDKIFNDMQSVLDGLNIKIIELSMRPIKSSLQVSLIVYKEDGVSINDCAEVHRTVVHRIELYHQNKDVFLEVSSPGLTRNFKSADEFAVFIGKAVRVLAESNSEWIEGIIDSVTDNSVILKLKDSTQAEFEFNKIYKAKLF